MLCDSHTHQKLFKGGEPSQIGTAIALLHRDGTLRCTVKKATVRRREHDDGDEWECDVLLAVELLDPVFQMDADTEVRRGPFAASSLFTALGPRLLHRDRNARMQCPGFAAESRSCDQVVAILAAPS